MKPFGTSMMTNDDARGHCAGCRLGRRDVVLLAMSNAGPHEPAGSGRGYSICGYLLGRSAYSRLGGQRSELPSPAHR